MERDMSEVSTITTRQFIAKVPQMLKLIPKFKRGLDMAQQKPGVRIGLGWGVEMAREKNPQGPAILYENRSISYQELDDLSNQYAHFFKSRGIKEKDVVSVFIENRPELLIVCTALSKLGAISALVNTSQKGKVLVHSINLVSPKLLVLGEEGVSAIEEVQTELKIENPEPLYLADNDTLTEAGNVPEGYFDLVAAVREQSIESLPVPNIVLSDPLFYIYTSGTTGLPKAARISNYRWQQSLGGIGYAGAQLGTTDVFYSTLPLYHATAMVVCWGSAIAGGAGFAIRRKFSASEFWDDCIKFNATAIGYVGELCRYLMNQPEKASDRKHKVKKMLGNGLRPGVWKPFKQRFKIDSVLELYSASESNVGMINILNFDECVGFQMGKSALVQFDKETEKPIRGANGFGLKTKKGGKGLLLGHIRDDNPFDGYTDGDKSESKIIRDLFKKGDAWFDTGDVMRDMGFMHLQFVDRLGDTYRWKGENVSTTEVENILTECKEITECVAYGVEIPETNGRAGMASICLEGDESDVDFKKILAELKSKMPAYALPVFLRIRPQMDTTGTFKHKKSDLKDESYNIEKFDDNVYAYLPGAKEYAKIDVEVRDKINSGSYRF